MDQAILTVLRVLDLVIALSDFKEEARAEIDPVVEKLRDMIAKGENPTDEDWEVLDIRTNSLLEQLKNNAEG